MIKHDQKLHPRDIYLDKLIAFQDTEPVKVVTGIRRCGKSSLLKLMQKHLMNTGVDQSQIQSMNFESMEYRDMDTKTFYHYVNPQSIPHIYPEDMWR